ncbi:hypothetical protein CHS0354_041454 [Potamilus streckersoni]|uniref:Max-binding protein MNT n=1 Tax=Potamilus streckersoni TaxID=2493646 RepID=A0AAE0TB42_9BIVA|nr:hypothetical protein CHS0354_041454 [Potamilus streckersoni]
MSLETLIEAAEFLEWKGQGPQPDSRKDLHQYAKPPSISSESEESNISGKIYEFDENGKEKRRPGGAGTREVHNKLEKNRRAHLKECFDILKKQIPNMEDKRTSNLSILRGSLRYVQTLKRKEKEYEQEMQRLAREKIMLQERMDTLKSELAKMNIDVDLKIWTQNSVPDDENSSYSTVTESGSPIMSEDEDEDTKKGTGAARSSLKIVPTKVPLIQPRLPVVQVTFPRNTLPRPVLQPGLSSIQLNSNSTSVIVRAPQAVNGPHGIATPILTTLAAPAIKQEMGVRPPVTQILHQTLTQRQALLRQQITAAPSVSTTVSQSALQTQAKVVATIPSVTMATATTAASKIPTPSAISIPIMQNRFPSSDSLSIPIGLVTVTTSGVTPSVNNKTQGVTLTVPSFQSIPLNVNMSLSKGFAHPILVTSLTANPSVIVSSAAVTATTSVVATTNTIDASVISTTTNTTKTIPSTCANQTVVSAPSIPLAAFPIGRFFAPHLMSSGQLTFSPLIAAPTLTRTTGLLNNITTTTPQTTSTVIVTTAATPAPSIASIPSVMSLAQMAPLMSQMTVMPPGLQLSAAGTTLTQAQLGSLLASPLMKQYSQIPTIIPSILQTGQLQPVKPLVMVSVPSVTTSAAATTVSSATSKPS